MSSKNVDIGVCTGIQQMMQALSIPSTSTLVNTEQRRAPAKVQPHRSKFHSVFLA